MGSYTVGVSNSHAILSNPHPPAMPQTPNALTLAPHEPCLAAQACQIHHNHVKVTVIVTVPAVVTHGNRPPMHELVEPLLLHGALGVVCGTQGATSSRKSHVTSSSLLSAYQPRPVQLCHQHCMGAPLCLDCTACFARSNMRGGPVVKRTSHHGTSQHTQAIPCRKLACQSTKQQRP
jgi:hypothetical protein